MATFFSPSQLSTLSLVPALPEVTARDPRPLKFSGRSMLTEVSVSPMDENGYDGRKEALPSSISRLITAAIADL